MIKPAASIHRVILIRLLAVATILLVVLGGLAYWLENYRMDQFVLRLADEAVRQFKAKHSIALFEGDSETNRDDLDHLLTETGFAGIRLYSHSKSLLRETWHMRDLRLDASLKEHLHIFPEPGEYHQNKLWASDRLHIQTVVPLTTADKKLYGYFEGVYAVDPELVASGKRLIRDTLVVVIIVVLLTTLVLYPIILALNRGTLRLSARLLESNVDLMRVLGSAIAKRDADTDEHNYRVTLYAVRLAEAMQRPDTEIAALIAGAFLHDIGKIGISDVILRKPGKLTDVEFAIMKSHAAIGQDIVKESAWLKAAQEIVANHHEKFDGSGYPQGLKQAAIPFNARLFAIVDVFDALNSARPYKDALPLSEVMRLLEESRASHFDPGILDVFERLAPSLFNEIAGADQGTLKEKLSMVIRKYFRLTLDTGNAPTISLVTRRRAKR